ncbi:HD-GYP domain-containing protein [Amphibacillus indicireducens]|uniref:HD-GYP domain-containing protein n=1 Tax=Amphibacillus indicireducens TaxID=1076330 RepID=A0ABP7VY68_9BACI
MFVHPNQLVEKCLIVSDVFGQTNYPIIEKDTVVTTTHIKVLNSFLIDRVEVSPKLANGEPYKPTKVLPIDQELIKRREVKKKVVPFDDHYLKVVKDYQKMFNHWQSGKALDINQVRQMIVPLIERVDENQAAIFLLGKQTTKEEYLYQHSVAVSLLAVILAKRLGFEKESTQIGLAALLADSGMAKVNQRILNHHGKLSPAEFAEIKKHPTFSYRMIEKNPALTQSAKLAVLQHHERVNGRGYPLGIDKTKINPYAKIISIADAYHAMTSYRSYQAKRPFYQVIAEMKKEADQQFDARYLKVFMTCLEDALLEEKVYLSNGQTGNVVALRFSSYPEVIIQIHGTHEILSMLEQENLKIESLIHS